MFNKFRNRLPGVSLVIVVIIFVLLLPFIAFVMMFSGLFYSKEDEEFKEEYLEFLRENEGVEFFCYTNRKTSEKEIEKYIIPYIDKNVHVVKLTGKNVACNHNERFISHALYNIRGFGFPNIMKISNLTMVDHSLHKDLYDAIGNGKYDELFEIYTKGSLAIKSKVREG